MPESITLRDGDMLELASLLGRVGRADRAAEMITTEERIRDVVAAGQEPARSDIQALAFLALILAAPQPSTPPPREVVGHMLDLIDDEYKSHGAQAVVGYTYFLAAQLKEVLATAVQAAASSSSGPTEAFFVSDDEAEVEDVEAQA